MANITISYKGFAEAEKTLQRLTSNILPVSLTSLVQSAENVMQLSKEVYCPVDTGALRSSGTVLGELTKDAAIVQMGYGGPSVSYAIYVHEMNRHYRNGKVWKYLETPLKAESQKIMTKLAADIQEFLTSKGEGSVTVEF